MLHCWYCWLGLLTCKSRLPYYLYCVGGDVKHCSIQSLLNPINQIQYTAEFCTELLCGLSLVNWGYRGGSPTAVRLSDPALCGSCPLVTPYYCRLGDLLCYFVYIVLCALLSMYICIWLFPLFSLHFVASPSVLWYCWLGLLTCKNRLPYNLYCVGGDVKHCSLTHYQKQ